MRSLTLFFAFILGNFFFAGRGISQEAELSNPTERLIIETKWQYTYTLHAESNTIIHKAEDKYEYFLYFRYDYSYLEFLNGHISRGGWSLDGNKLNYSFRHVDQFKVVELNKSVMVLEFTQRNSKGTFQYHFVRVDSEHSPFPKPDNELPEIIVETEDPNAPVYTRKRKKQGFLSRLFNNRKKFEEYLEEEELTYINVELIGGGYYGGIDPVLKDFIHIKSDGRLVQEFQSVHAGLHITKKTIDREELEMFADWVVKQGFFEMERAYGCTDAECQKRKMVKPTPIPLRIAIAYGDKKKVVTIAIWGQDDRKSKYVEYPPALDGIIDAIQRMASRLDDDPMVRK